MAGCGAQLPKVESGSHWVCHCLRKHFHLMDFSKWDAARYLLPGQPQKLWAIRRFRWISVATTSLTTQEVLRKHLHGWKPSWVADPLRQFLHSDAVALTAYRRRRRRGARSLLDCNANPSVWHSQWRTPLKGTTLANTKSILRPFRTFRGPCQITSLTCIQLNGPPERLFQKNLQRGGGWKCSMISK